jgi:hypothetical protein
MSELIFPVDDVVWPSLGGTVLDWMQSYACHGPGDVVGQPLKLSQEQEREVWRLYEVYPRGHDREGRRRFHTAGLMKCKSWSKTELMALIAFAELMGPVRCDGFDGEGSPVARPVVDPLVLLFAWSGGQSEELAYHTLKVIAEESELADELNVTEQFVEKGDGHGVVKSMTRSPNRADGSRASWHGWDETWRWVDPAHHAIRRITEQNAAKRKDADAWNLSVTTAFTPGRGSVAEELAEQAKAGIAAGFYFSHRYAADSHDLETIEGREDALRDAGTAEHMDTERIAELWDNPDFPHEELEALWLCRTVASADQVFPLDIVKERARPEVKIDSRAGNRWEVFVGFDGSRTSDSTAFVCTDLAGFQWVPYLWVRPPETPGWEVPVNEVEDAWTFLNREFRVRGALWDPRWWEVETARWEATWKGKGKAEAFHTEAYGKMSGALRAYVNAWRTGAVTYSGQRQFTEHLANARKYFPGRNGPDGEPIYVMTKDRRNSPHKIDVAMAGCLSWTAYLRGGAGGVKAKGSRQGTDWRMYG